jgi:protocatechuate 3,4-dioxygenase beta subunit
MFTSKALEPGWTNTRYADLELDPMQYEGRRHAARFRIRLESSQEHAPGADSMFTFDLALVDRDSREPVADAAVVVGSSRIRDTFWQRQKILYCTDSQGRCRIRLPRDGLTLFEINAQKQDYSTILKSWSNSGSWPVGRALLVNLPQRYVMEMVRASALGGIVRDTEGNAIEGVEVRFDARLEEPSGTISVRRSIQTDANGRWRVEGVPPEADRISMGLRHPAYGGDNGRSRRIAGQDLLDARAFKHVETLEKGMMISGKVLDDQGRAIANATVIIASRSFNPLPAFTDESGAFRIACSADTSAYREIPGLVVEAPGYAPATQIIDFQVKPAPLEFRLTCGRDIACRVVDTQGRPVAGAWTVVEPLQKELDYSLWLEDTNERGEFQVLNVPQSDVRLTVGKLGFLTVRDHVVTASQKEVLVTMKRALHAAGTVTDATTGKAIPNFEIATVFATSGGRTQTSSPAVFVEGAYELSLDEARPQSVRFQASAVGYEPATSQEIKVDEGEHTIDFKLTRSASFDEATAGRPREQIQPTGPRRITGVVRDGKGEPVPDAIIKIFPWMGEEIITDARGTFTLKLRGTSGTTYSMSRQETTYLMARQYERNLAAVVVLDASADTVNVTLSPGVILSGKVVDTEGKGIRNAKLSLIFQTSTVGYGSGEAAKADDAGHYEIRAIPSEQKYSVSASAAGYGERYAQVNTGGAAKGRIELEPLVLSVANLSVTGVVVDELNQPVSGLRIYAYGNGQASRETVSDEKGRFTIENVCADPINIQANSLAGSPQRLHGRAQAQGGAKEIKIMVEQMDERGRRIPKQPPSFSGKPLPDLKEFGIDLPSADLAGKSILVCFWDMNQRPSRNCITQLAKQAEALKQKGVIIVAVQASTVDKNTLNEWVKKNNIAFPVGMIQGNEEKIRFGWGVKALPWLILTDKEHVVSVEGFAVSELQQHIGK